MIRPAPFPIVRSTCALLFSVLAATGLQAGDGPWDGWKTLRLNARAAPLVRGNVEMRRSSTAGKILLQTSTSARFFGATIGRSQTESVLDAGTGLPESYVSYNHKRGRRYVFAECSYTVERLSPPENPEAPLEQWTISSKDEFAYPRTAEGEVEPVLDYYGMLLYLGRVRLERPGDAVELWVATSKGPTPYRISIAESRRGERRVRNPETGKKENFAVDELRVMITPTDPERADEGFLKLQGETEMWIESGSKTLLHLSGNAPNVPGRLRLEIAEID